MPIPLPLLAAAGTTVTAALFACAHVALTSLSDARLAAVVETDAVRGRALARVAQSRDAVHARYLVGAVGSSFVAVASLTMWVASLELTALARLGLLAAGLLAQCISLETAATLGRSAPESVAKLAARYLMPLELLLAPVAAVAHAFARAIPVPDRREDPRVTETEVEYMVEQGEKSGALESTNAELIRKVLEFPELTARDAMVPRKTVVGIRLDTPLTDVVALVTQTGHSRYPVYRETIDDAFGLVYAKDLFRSLMADGAAAPASGTAKRPARLLDVLREPLKIVPESRPLSELLPEMRQGRQHMALVVDEFGGTSGVVTLEDILEEIVGDIRDEHDPETAPIHALDDGSLLVDATVLVCDLSRYLGFDLDPEDKYDSLGGMIVEQLGSVPTAGTTLETRGVTFIVRDADEKRVQQVAVSPPPSNRAPAPSADELDAPKSGEPARREAS